MKQILAIMAAMLMGLASARGNQVATQPSATAHLKVRIDASDAYLGVVRDFETHHLGDFRFDSAPVFPHPLSFDIEQSADGDTPLLLIWIDTSASGSWAPQAADVVVSQLQARLATLVQQQRAEWKARQQEQWEKASGFRHQEESIEGRIKLIDRDVADISAQTALPDLSPRNLEALLQSLQEQYETAQIGIAGKSARKDALSDAVGRLTVQVHDRVDSDEIVRQFQVVVKQREEELDVIKSEYKMATVGQGAVNAAIAALAEAKAKVMERQEEVAKSAGADQIQQWNQDLLLLSVDLADLRAQSDALKQHLEVLGIARRKELSGSTRDSLQAELDKIKEELDALINPQAEADSPLSDPLPKLTVVESQYK